MGVVYLKLNGLDPSYSPGSSPTRSHDIDSSPSGTGAVWLQANKLPTPAPFSSVTPRSNESTPFLNQSLSNMKPVFNVPSNLPTARQSPPNPPVISLTDSRPNAPPSDTRTDTSFTPSTASISLSEEDVLRMSNDTSLLAPKERPPTSIVFGDQEITPAATVAGRPLPTKQPVSPGVIPWFLRSKGPPHTQPVTPLPPCIAGSSLSAMELFQRLPSIDTIIFATLTTRPKTQTLEEGLEADVVPNYCASDSKVVEFQNTPEAAQAMLHLSFEKTLSVGVLLDALISLDGETPSKGSIFKGKLGILGRQVPIIR